MTLRLVDNSIKSDIDYNIDMTQSVAVNDFELFKAARPLLLWAAAIDELDEEINSNDLRQEMVAKIQLFERKAKLAGAPAMVVLSARYILCTFIDEMITKREWNVASTWSQQSLLCVFHQDTWGGQVFFELLDRFKISVEKNLDLLCIMYYCLALGFEGKFQLQPEADERLKSTRVQLYLLLQNYLEQNEALQLHRFQEIKVNKRDRWSLSKIFLTNIIIIMVIFFGFKAFIINRSDQVYQNILKIEYPVNVEGSST